MFITRSLSLLLFPVLLVLTGIASAATYHVSNQGSDQNDGLSPATAWATLASVNAAPLHPGDRVLFRRNDVWRGQLIPHSGNDQSPVTYSAYGEGAKPLFLGSVAKNTPADWTQAGDGFWTADNLKADVGNIIFGNEASFGVKKWHDADLKQEGDYWYDESHRTVKLQMAENPAKRYSRIECAIDEHIILQNGASYVIYENLTLKYGAAHGIGGGSTHHIIVRDCDIGFIGGGVLKGYGNGMVRFGNGIEFWGAAHDNLVERCRLWEIYDAALTNQSTGPNTPHYNIVYRNNIIWNSEYSFEYWNNPEISETHDVYFVNNTCVNAGFGWGHAQRPDPSGRHLCFYHSAARAKNIVIRNNIFDGAKGPAFYAPHWSKEQIDALMIDRNCWRQSEGVMIDFQNAKYTMADFAKYQSEWKKEPHSICAAARLVDVARLNFHLAAGSPCIDAGEAAGIERDFDGLPIPQGKAPDLGVFEFRR